MSEDRGSRGIEIEANGPYRVSGVRLLRTAIVETEYGEPVDWDEGPDLATEETYWLCRCGGSSRKPFCDGTHRRNGFDGTTTADRAPTAERRRTFAGDGVLMSDDPTFCTHAGFCGDRFTKVWMMIEETGDPETRARLMGMVERCPSGRLAYSVPPDPADVEPGFQPSIGVQPDGPLWVRGGVEILAADGTTWETRNRVTLCRCGRSRNKPFCDGSHVDAGFSDPVTPSSD